MSAIAFGIPMQFDKAHIEGISKLEAEDIKYAEQLGYRIKLLGITKRTAKGIELRVHPTLVPMQRLIASVEGAMNAVLVKGDAVGTTLYYGPGAGSEPTASAVIADLVDVTRMHTADPENHVPHLALQADAMALPWLTIGHLVLLPCAWPTSQACHDIRASLRTAGSRSMRCSSASRPKAKTRPTSSC
jgi:homoserine dehydrogenase